MQISTKEYLKASIDKRAKKEEELKYLKEMLKALEEKLNPLKQDIQKTECEIERINNLLDLNGYGESEIITVKLGDLINELSILSGIDQSKIKVSFSTGIYIIGKKPVDKDTLLKHNQKLNRRIMSLTLKGGKIYNDNHFIYTYLDTPMNFDEIQADGKSLYDHCEAVWGHIDDMEWKDIDTDLEIYYDIENIICHLNLNEIIKKEEYENSYYPKDLLTNALLNCAVKYTEYSSKNKQKLLKKNIK